uniref:DUF4220 domain-containing protein n=1 Tax=Leersia perrieri TaxID=77586 RepID=A0A0D9XU95_9ORYZ
MVGIQEIRGLVSSLFVMLNLKKFILFRIEFLVVLVTVLFLVMFIMDIFRRHIRNATMKAIFTLLDAVSDSIVIYLLGAMQTAPFKNELFSVWALVLVNFRYNVDFISGYGVPDRQGRRFTEWRNVVKLLGSAFLNLSRGSKFARPLWSLWALQIGRSWYRFHSRCLAYNSNWHGRSSELVSEYMRDTSNWKPNECDPGSMDGYKYLVYGEIVELQKPPYLLCPNHNIPNPKNIGNTICPCDHIPKPDNSRNTIQQKDLKDLLDLSLAFSLSRLLRCRLEDAGLQRDTFRINKNLIKRRIIEEEDANRAFGIMEQQMAFLNDYFNTRFPMVFWRGLISLYGNFLASTVTFFVVLWLSVDIRKVYKPPKGELVHLKHGVNVDMIITWVFMSFMMFKEIWEMVTYLLSDWTRLLLVCRGGMDKLINVFLDSYDDRPKIWNLAHKISTGIVPKKENGAKPGNAIDVPECVKRAILEILNSIDLTAGHLPKVVISLSDDKRKKYRWACLELQTCSHAILVWHIATSICKMKLAQDKEVDLSKPGWLSWFTSCFCSSMYLVDEKKLDGELQNRYIVANSLSRYCAHLLVFKPDLISDSFFVPKMIFQETVALAYDDILKDCDSLKKRYDKLTEEEMNNAQVPDEEKITKDVLRKGAILANQLLNNENNEDPWEILSEVWAELLVHLAPSWNASAHKNCLESGGEFITHIWALLWHCGITKSELWPVEDVPRNNAQGASQNNSAENNQVQPVRDEMAQVGGDQQMLASTSRQ